MVPKKTKGFQEHIVRIFFKAINVMNKNIMYIKNKCILYFSHHNLNKSINQTSGTGLGCLPTRYPLSPPHPTPTPPKASFWWWYGRGLVQQLFFLSWYSFI